MAGTPNIKVSMLFFFKHASDDARGFWKVNYRDQGEGEDADEFKDDTQPYFQVSNLSGDSQERR